MDGATGVNVTLNAKGQATFATSSLSDGPHTIAVKYLGDSTYATSSGTLIQSVDGGPAVITKFSGDGQSTPYLSSFPKPLVVLVTDASGNPVPGAFVEFKGTGLTFPTNPVLTGYDGKASTGAIASGQGALTAMATAIASPVALTSPTYFSLNSTSATPTFSPGSGTYTSAQSVTISDSTAGAVIYYTTDGTTPTANSTKYTGAISVSTSETIAIATGYSNTTVVSASYIINIPQAATPSFTPAAGTYTSNQSVTIGDTSPDAVIYCTTDGSTPTTNSTICSGPISVTSSETITAIATATGYSTSSVASVTYTISIPPVVVATPVFSPAAGIYTSAQTVTISDGTPGAVIYYTTDGSTPTTSSAKYTAALTVGTTETIQAIAAVAGDTNSAVASATYTINLPAATFALTTSPASATVTAGQSATYTVTVTPQNNFVQTVTFACPGLAASLQCTFAPATVTPAGAAVNSTLTVSTTTASADTRPLHSLPWKAAGGIVTMSLLLWPFRRRRLHVALLLTMFLVVGGALIGCSSQTTSTTTTPPPQSQSYTVSITATGGGASQSSTVFLTVNN